MRRASSLAQILKKSSVYRRMGLLSEHISIVWKCGEVEGKDTAACAGIASSNTFFQLLLIFSKVHVAFILALLRPLMLLRR